MQLPLIILLEILFTNFGDTMSIEEKIRQRAIELTNDLLGLCSLEADWCGICPELKEDFIQRTIKDLTKMYEEGKDIGISAVDV